jgi:hypothetical protein
LPTNSSFRLGAATAHGVGVVQIYGHDLTWAVLVAYYLCCLLVGAGVGTPKSKLVQTFIGLIVSIADIRPKSVEQSQNRCRFQISGCMPIVCLSEVTTGVLVLII